MNVPFSATTLDLVTLLSGLALVMSAFFGITTKRHRWLANTVWATFTLQCLLIILSTQGTKLRLLAILILIFTAIVGVVLVRKRRLELS